MLRNRRWRRALLQGIADVERLVLLGDLLELRHGPVRDALAVAREVLVEIGAALPPGAEVVIVPGNHDHHLLSAWLQRRRGLDPPEPFALESAVRWLPDEPLATVAGWLEPASLRAAYPGVWLRDDVYATHGHYSDRHTTVPLFERVAAGATARVVGAPAVDPRTIEAYEAALEPLYAWIHAVAQHGGARVGRGSHGLSTRLWSTLSAARRRGLRDRALSASFPLAVAALNRAGLGPLRADISGVELRRAGLRALGEVLVRLEIAPSCVIFGHTHRAGPLPADELDEWRAPNGALLHNSGCWVHEPAFLGARPAASPYRSGFSILIEDQQPPRLANLLDRFTVPGQA